MWQGFPLRPDQASTIAVGIDHLYYFLTAVDLFFTALIFLTIFFFAVRYRRRSATERPAKTKTFLPLELSWTVIPMILCGVMFTWSASLFIRNSRPPKNATEIFVIGKQWMWKIQHPEGNREIDELHVPLGTDIRLIMTSEDVIHSFYVPAFRMKMDVVPGRYTSTWFKATKTGKYHLFCAEYCGTKHSEMVGSVYVMDPVDYEDWLNRSTTATQSMAQAGEKLFTQLGCQTCHVEESGARGPSLHGLYNKPVSLAGGGVIQADDGYLRQSILDPAGQVVDGFLPIMPTYKGQVSEEDVLQLISYIKSLSIPQAVPSHPAEESQ